MALLKTITGNIDTFQQNHKLLAFPLAVVKRYGDDETGKQAALITYYGFLSLFPLLLVFITILNIITSNNDDLRNRISMQLFEYFPALGSQLQSSVHGVKGSGIALVLEILILIYGARGLAQILQEAFDRVWHVDRSLKKSFVAQNLHSFGMMAAVGGGIIIGAVIGYVLGSVLDIGVIGKIVITLLNAVITCALLLSVFRLGTSSTIKLHSLLIGAIIAGLLLLTVQHFGVDIMSNQLKKLNSTSGSFALALGMLFWIYLQAQIIMYALTITAVRTQHDWPKRFFDT